MTLNDNHKCVSFLIFRKMFIAYITMKTGTSAQMAGGLTLSIRNAGFTREGVNLAFMDAEDQTRPLMVRQECHRNDGR